MSSNQRAVLRTVHVGVKGHLEVLSEEIKHTGLYRPAGETQSLFPVSSFTTKGGSVSPAPPPGRVNVHRNINQFSKSKSPACTSTTAAYVTLSMTHLDKVRGCTTCSRCTSEVEVEAVLLGRGGSGTPVCEKLLILLFYDLLWRSLLQSAPMRLEMCD